MKRVLVPFLVGCGAPEGGAPVFADGAFATEVERSVIHEGLARPRDLAFDRRSPWDLWIVEQADEAVTVLRGVDQRAKVDRYDDDVAGPHFLARPAGIAFGDDGAMATIHDTDERTQGPDGTPPDFMGPTLWTTDLRDFDAGHHGHLDMLHDSPLGMGIAWERDNAYWVFDGWHGSVTRYDFGRDHGLGGSDHSDGEVARFLEGEVLRAEDGTPSHLWYDPDTAELYVVDTGHGRVIALDTTSGERGDATTPNYDGGDQYRVDGAVYRVVAEGAEVGLSKPSGLAARDGVLFVSDAGEPQIVALSTDGEVLDVLPVRDTANGLAFDPDGRLYLVDPDAGEVVRYAGMAEQATGR